MSLRVLEAGWQTLLVDFGRPASRSLGVPLGGAADHWSLALGNALVGNVPDATALEIALAGPTLQAESAVAGVVFGAPFDLATDRQTLIAGKTFNLEAGEILRVRGAAKGMRAYLCVAGGFDAPTILGSRSALAPIRAGEVLKCSPGALPPRFLDASATTTLPASLPHVLRVLPGAQFDWFEPDALARRTFAVTPAGNRMGLRLHSDPLTQPKRELVSEPVCPGTVQVTNDGQCIVLGIDGQSIGGYAKVAQVIRADLDYLGQLRPGDSIQFKLVTLEQAETAYFAKLAELRRWLARIAAATECSGVAALPSL